VDPAVRAWLEQALPGQQITGTAPLGGGHSNENILVTTGSGGYVLRRYRRGSRAAAARTCAIEAALAARLGAGTVPVPEVIAADPAGAAAGTAGSRQLVHSDYNGKNLLAVCRGGRWLISAVLDWEFAFSGSPLTDVGNMLRFRDRYPPGFTDGFLAGYQDAGGQLPPRWREISEALDLYALADFLTRPPDHPYFAKAVALIRNRLPRASEQP
jgi:aminoglycoside phosphotransferase (APT) family kinase protein